MHSTPATALRDTLEGGWTYAMQLCVEPQTAEVALRRAWSRAVARGLESQANVLRDLVHDEAVLRLGLDEPTLIDDMPASPSHRAPGIHPPDLLVQELLDEAARHRREAQVAWLAPLLVVGLILGITLVYLAA